MKYIFLSLAVAISSFSAFATNFQNELGGNCVIYASSRSEILFKVEAPFRFPEAQTINDGDNTYTFGTGTASVNENIQMMNTKKNIIEKPLQIDMTVIVSPDGKTKKLAVDFSMFNIFTNRQESFKLEDRRVFNLSINENFSYFQEGFALENSDSAGNDKITTSSAFCHFDDTNPTP